MYWKAAALATALFALETLATFCTFIPSVSDGPNSALVR